MKVREWMSPDPINVGPATSAQEAKHLLNEQGIRHLPVVQRHRVVGIVSDRDVRTTAALAGSVEAVMSAPVHLIAPDETVEAAARLMLSRRVSALPVIDPEFGLVGIITTTDCLLALLMPQPAVVLAPHASSAIRERRPVSPSRPRACDSRLATV
jgi:acetoin utilization protein AcuB